jgi:hypothetical protein
VKLRMVPWNTNPQQQNPPIMTGLSQPPLAAIRLRPAPYLLMNDPTYPIVTGVPASWSEYPEWWTSEGAGPTTRMVICTNVPPQPQNGQPGVNPSAIYTQLIVFPSQWDDLFEEGMVAFLAQKLALPLARKGEKPLALKIRDEQIMIAKAAISEARAQSGNEGSYPQTTDHNPDWLRVRNDGAGNYWGRGGMGDGWSGPGILWGGWDAVGFADGSVY